MNIFYLDRDPEIAAQMICDKHVVKMILESAQMLSSAHRFLDGDGYADKVGLYKMAHKNQPALTTEYGFNRWQRQPYSPIVSDTTPVIKGHVQIKSHQHGFISYISFCDCAFRHRQRLILNGSCEPRPSATRSLVSHS